MSGKLAFVGDVHLDPDDPLLPEFIGFLDGLAARCSRIVFTGDLFTIWLGRAELQQPHHHAVLAKLSELRANGVSLRYIEGNHDFRIRDCHEGAIFDEVASESLSESIGGLRILAAHGDMANSEDRRYRRWRRFSRSSLIWGFFNLLPRGVRIRLAESTERRMRSSNLDHKKAFPLDEVLAYARSYLDRGHDLVVLGHFHEEHDLMAGSEERAGRVIVLPEWKGSRRHLEIGSSGDIEFVDSAERGA